MIYINSDKPDSYSIVGRSWGNYDSKMTIVIPKKDLISIDFKLRYENNMINSVYFYYVCKFKGKKIKIEDFRVKTSLMIENFQNIKKIYHTLDNDFDGDTSDYIYFLRLLIDSSNELLPFFEGEDKAKFNLIIETINYNFYEHFIAVLNTPSYMKVGGSPYIAAGVAGAVAGPAVGMLAGVNKEEKNRIAKENNKIVSYKRFTVSYQKEKLIEDYDQALKMINKSSKARKLWIKKKSKVYDEKIDNILKSLEENNKGGCYVATCVYGSYNCPEVWTLRRYRDNTLAKTWHGRLFIKVYYAISPKIVKQFGNTTWFKKMWKAKLDNFVEKLQSEGVENTPYDDKNW